MLSRHRLKRKWLDTRLAMQKSQGLWLIFGVAGCLFSVLILFSLFNGGRDDKINLNDDSNATLSSKTFVNTNEDFYQLLRRDFILPNWVGTSQRNLSAFVGNAFCWRLATADRCNCLIGGFEANQTIRLEDQMSTLNNDTDAGWSCSELLHNTATPATFEQWLHVRDEDGWVAAVSFGERPVPVIYGPGLHGFFSGALGVPPVSAVRFTRIATPRLLPGYWRNVGADSPIFNDPIPSQLLMIILPVSLMPDRVLAVCDSAQHSAAECFINKQPKSTTRFFSVFIVRLLDVLAAQNDAPLHFSGCDAPCWHSLFETPLQDRVMFRLSSPASPSKVTLVTQLTVNRLKRLILSARLWRNDSPVAAAIYINSPMEIIQLFFYLLTAGETLMGRLSIAIVIPATETVAGGYPINKLRNTALLMVRTRALLMIESDFIPSTDLYLQASTTIVPYLYRRYRKDLPFTAVVIPCFGLSPAVEEPVRDVRELRRLIDQSLAYVTDSGSGHGPTRNSLFLAFDAPSIKKEQSPHVSKPETPHNQLVESEHFYETCYEGQWEPYYILYSPESACYLNVGDENARKSYFDTPDGWLSKQSKCIRPFVTASSSVGSWDVPLYDARFTNQGGDKQSHAAWMNALGTRFMVYRHGFLSHIAHGRMSWVGQGFRPGTRKSWDYFGDFLGSLQARFGRMFRWPRGCSYPFHRDQDRRIVVV